MSQRGIRRSDLDTLLAHGAEVGPGGFQFLIALYWAGLVCGFIFPPVANSRFPIRPDLRKRCSGHLPEPLGDAHSGSAVSGVREARKPLMLKKRLFLRLCGRLRRLGSPTALSSLGTDPAAPPLS